MRALLTMIMTFMALITSMGQGTMLLRQPTLHGNSVVFVYANDLWITGSDGGDAHRLTSSVGSETNPHFSPDGKWIAFTAQYDGNSDVYVIPSAGGEPERLTWHPGNDLVQGWMPDSKRVIFQSGRQGKPTQSSRLFTASLDGGIPDPLPVVRAAYGEVSSDGKQLAYTPFSFWDPEWRNYRGGQAQPIWIVDLETLKLIQTPRTDNERHMDPVWVGESLFFLSERDYASNIWSYDLSNKKLTQHTYHADFDVKSLDSDGEKIVYEQGGYLHLLDLKTDNQTQLKIEVKGDFHWARERWEKINPARMLNARLSSTGKRAIIEYRGEILTIPAEKGTWRNITNSPGVADRSPVWSPTGDKVAWFSDASGEYQLVLADQNGSEHKRITIPGASFFFKPEWSPDGKFIAFTDTHYNIWYVDIASNTIKRADTDTYAHPDRTMNPVWSPDSKWIAYPKLLDSQFKAIMVYNVITQERYQLTDGMADAISPVWDESGKYIYFLASTNFGLGTGWLDMSSYDVSTTRTMFMVLLNKDVASPFLPESDEEIIEEKGASDQIDDKKKKTKKSDTEEDKKPAEIADVKIDPDNINQRIVGANIYKGNYLRLIKGPKGQVFILERKPGLSGLLLKKYTVDKKEAKEFLEGINYCITSGDGKKILYQSNNTWGIADTKAAKIKNGDGKLNLSNISVKVDPAKEWQQIYREGWRYQRDFLYVDNVHGAPWDEVFEWYKPWVNHVRHRSEMTYIIDILGGEVAVGHSYTSGGDFPSVDRVPVGLLGADFKVVNNRYRISRIYRGDNWNDERGPLAEPGMKVKNGDYILAVNGVSLTGDDNIYQLFEGTAGMQTRLTISSDPNVPESHEVVVIPIANEGRLRTNDWVEENRRVVDELSEGKLAYVWLPNTGRGGFNSFNRYYFAQQDKKGAVIDERNNGGGSAADYIVDILARDLMGYFNSNAADKRPFTTPMAGLWGPKVMIINERAGSGGDLMPYLFKQMKIGPLVGTKTWGGLVGTWDTPPFLDGGRMVAPRGGFINTKGEWDIEGEGIEPDIEVMQLPALESNGRDPQLEKAVEVALKLLETNGVVLKPEPPPPVRWKRPEYFKKK